MRRLMQTQTLFALLALCIAGCGQAQDQGNTPPVLMAPAEVRGTWVTTTANTAIATPADTHTSMQRLREMGLNTVYVEVWKNGYTQFPSETLEALIGVERRPHLMPGHEAYPTEQLGGQPRDLLEETLIAAHRNQLIYIGWFEYGFMAAYKETDNHLREQYPEWMTTTLDGSLVSDQNPFVWMNPMRPECQDFLLGLVLEAVDKYDLDGVQLDDRIAWPVTMGYDDYTKAVYAEEHNGAEPPADPRDPDWIAWRAGKVTEFAERFYRELKRRRPNLLVSISPAVYPWSLNNYNCDWKTWNDRGLMDEYVPQVYRMNYETFVPTWEDQVQAAGDRVDRLIAGLRIVGDGPDTTWPDVVKEIELVRAAGAGGHVHWFSRGVLETYAAEFAAFYDVPTQGRSANPLLPADWRPAPIVGEQSEGGGWSVQVAESGRYRVIARSGTVWRVVESRSFDAGVTTLHVDHAEAVELLVDRREDG